MTKEPPAQLQRPENRGLLEHGNGTVKPWEHDPELAQLKMAETMVERLGEPSIQTKEFTVAYSILTATNHTTEHPTGFDTSILINVLEQHAKQSVNRDGLYFRNYWAYMMKPKYIIQGNMAPGAMEEEKQSIAGRFVNWIRGGKKNEQQPTTSN
jgi:hypothetical protein